MDAFVLDPAESYADDGGAGRETKLSSEALGIVEFDAEEDSVGDHTHEVDEIFYVLDGRMTFRTDGGDRTVGTGGFAYVPAGTPHGFSHDSPARYLVISSPGGLERYFAEVEAAEERDAGEAELDAIAERYGTRFPD